MNNQNHNLQIAIRGFSLLLMAGLLSSAALGQTPASDNRSNAVHASLLKPRFKLLLAPINLSAASSRNAREDGSASSTVNLIPRSLGPNLQVLGGGTIGRLTKWTGSTGSNSIIGDSTIFEDKFGNVGIGTDSPTSRLTVNGTIQASGGSSVLHDSTLTGNGTTAAPLGVAVPLSLTGRGETILLVRNNSDRGDGVFAFGGQSKTSFGGNGVTGFGGVSESGSGGAGLSGVGGSSGFADGGTGVGASGGNSGFGPGGAGLSAAGGFGTVGGAGVIARGGIASGAGKSGGTGLIAQKGAGLDGATDGLAGDFDGDVKVSGTVKLGTNALLFAPGGEENLRIIRGAVDPAGSITLGSGFTIQVTDVGSYKIKFNNPFSTAPVVTISADVGFAHINCSASACSVLTLNTTLTPASLAFNFIAAGPQ